MRFFNRLCAILVVAAGSCLTVQADWIPLGRVDTDSIQSLTYGLSAFCRSAGLPYTLADLNQIISRQVAIPNLAGVDIRQPVAVHLLVDGSAPRATARIAALGIVELTDNGASLFATLDAVYAHRTEQVGGVLFSGRREGLSGSAQLAVSVRAGKAYVSETPETLVWALKTGRQTVAAAPAAGRLTLALVPAELAACLAATNNTLTAALPDGYMLPTGQVTRTLARLPALLQDTDSMALALDANGHALNATLTLGFKPGSTLRAWVAGMRPPELWYKCLAPREATLVAIAGQSGRGSWRERLGWTLDDQLPTLQELVGDRLMGETTTYLSSTRSGNGLVFVSMAKVLDPAESRRRLAKRLTGMTLPSGLVVRRTEDRSYAGVDVQCFMLTNATASITAPTNSLQPSVLIALANLLARVTILEAAVVGQDMTLVAGPPGAIEPVIDDLKTEKPPYPSLPSRCRRIAPDLPVEAAAVTQLGPVALLRQIIATLPGYKPSQLDQFATPGDGLVAWSTSKDGKYVGSLQIAANEIDAAQSVLTRGRPVIQELLLQMVMQQVMRQPNAEMDRSAERSRADESPSLPPTPDAPPLRAP